MVIRNKLTGKISDVDPKVQRVSRLRRRVFSWVRSMGSVSDYRVIMLSMTYHHGEDWRPDHIRSFMLAMRKKVKVLAYAWVLELQARGAPHYHVLLVVPKGVFVPCPDSSGLWLHGTTRTEGARSFFYIAKYTSKGCTAGSYPKGARIFAVFISAEVLSRLSLGRFHFRLSAYPVWLQLELSDLGLLYCLGQFELPRPFPGGGWLSICMGHLRLHSSPYEVVSF